jgi:hypothetical protein
MKPDKPPVPNLDDIDYTALSKEELNAIDAPRIKWLCCVQDCNCYSSAKNFDLLPLIWWRGKWVDIFNEWLYCGKHWKMMRQAQKQGKKFEPLSGYKPNGWHYRIKIEK